MKIFVQKKTLCLNAILAAMALWTFLLRDEAVYSGYARSDLAAHTDYIKLLLQYFRSGSLGLDAWHNNCCLGAPIFRTYQNLGYYLIAGFCYLFRIDNVPLAVHGALVAVLVLQVPIFYFCARRLGYSALVSVFAAWLSPLVATDRPVIGHEFGAYVFSGWGVFTQALAIGPFAMAITAVARLTGWVRECPKSAVKRSLEAGLWISVTFLLHHLLGAMVLIALGVLGFMALIGRKVSVVFFLQSLFIVGVVFVLLTGYQLLSIFEDKALMHASFLALDYKYGGYGFRETFRLLFEGHFFDSSRFPVFTVLVLWGLSGCFWGKDRSGRIAVTVLFFVALSFFIGRSIWGPVLKFMPLMENFQLERFSVLIHVTGVWLAAWGAYAIWVGAGWCQGRWAPKLNFNALGACLVAVALGYLVFERAQYLEQDSEMIAEQRTYNELYAKKGLFEPIRELLAKGNFWNARFKQPGLLYLGYVDFSLFVNQLGYPQLSTPLYDMTYASDTVGIFQPRRSSHFRVFNVSTVMLPNAGVVVPDFLKKTRSHEYFSVFQPPSVGYWDVIGIPHSRVTVGELEYLQAVNGWLDGPEPGLSLYPAIIPDKVVRAWPEVVPKRLTSDNAKTLGTIISSDIIRQGRSSAVLEAKTNDAYGLVRVSFHPRWRAWVNGHRAETRWVAPGFVAFPIERGVNRVEILFAPDRRREILWVMGIVVFIAVCAVLLRGRGLGPQNCSDQVQV